MKTKLKKAKRPQTVAAVALLTKYKSRLAVAEALLLGKIPARQQHAVGELCGRNLIFAARQRIEMEMMFRERAQITGESTAGRRMFDFED